MEFSQDDELDIEELKKLFEEPDPVEIEEPLPAEPQQPIDFGEGYEPDKQERNNWQKNVLVYLHDLTYMLAALIIVSLLLIRVVVVSGTSMYNTLLDGDYLFVLSNTIYTEPKQGDIIVISKKTFDNGAPIVKRVIATEGQTVDIDFNLGIVYVDGQALEEDYAYTATTRQEGMKFPLTVEEDCVFVLGDNREVSHDSRSVDIGLIRNQEILGKVLILVFPGTNGTDAYGNPNEDRDWTRIGVVE